MTESYTDSVTCSLGEGHRRRREGSCSNGKGINGGNKDSRRGEKKISL